MKHVLQILPALHQGGVEIGTKQVAKALIDSKKYQSYIMSAGGQLIPQIINDGTTHIHCDIGSKNPLKAVINIFKLAYYIKKYHIDIIHVRSRIPAIIAFFAKKITPCKSVSTIHAFYKTQHFLKKYYNSFSLRHDHIIAISYPVKEYIKQYAIYDDNKTTVIERGCDDYMYHDVHHDKARYFNNINIDNDTIVFAIIGRVSPTKKQDVAIKSFATFIKKYNDKAVLLLIGNKKNNSNYPNHCDDIIQQYHLENHVFFIDHQDIIAYHAIDYIISCRDDEAFGRTVIEAQIAGCYVICADTGTPASLLVHDSMGSIFRANMADDLSTKLYEAVCNHQHLKRAKRLENRNLIFPRFSKQHMCDSYLNIYDHIKK